jgi:hypothetical protein
MVLPENSFAELMILLSFVLGELLLCFSNLSDSIIINSFSKSLISSILCGENGTN